jgi:hypothetical protein
MNEKEKRKSPEGKHSLTKHTTRVGATKNEEQTGGKEELQRKVNTYQTLEKKKTTQNMLSRGTA